MLRFLAGVGSTLLLVAAGFFLWRGQAEREGEQAIPPAPEPRAATAFMAPLQPRGRRPERPPEASPKSKEEKRFSRADKDKDGRITRDELLQPRRKAYAKLDTNGDGRLAFEEWAVKTVQKFAGADRNRDGQLDPAEYATTAPKKRAKPKPECSC
jgi:hypothetical protein